MPDYGSDDHGLARWGATSASGLMRATQLLLLDTGDAYDGIGFIVPTDDIPPFPEASPPAE